jgi:hypothetical protein
MIATCSANGTEPSPAAALAALSRRIRSANRVVMATVIASASTTSGHAGPNPRPSSAAGTSTNIAMASARSGHTSPPAHQR